jgi:hypothetical protein
MDLLTLDDFKGLVNQRAGPSVSLYMPTHRAGADTRQDPIRFRNLLGAAKKHLREEGLRTPDIYTLLAPARRLLVDSAFWWHQSDGLAMFFAEDAFHTLRLPLSFDEMLVVADRFHLNPLLPLLTGDGHFFILALSQNQVRFLEGTRHTVDEIFLEGVPTSLAEALQHERYEKQLQFHTRAPALAGQRAAGFHGHSPGEDEKKRVLRYFRQIDAGLQELLRDERAPLVLFGVDYLFPIYQEANTYPHLLEDGVAGNPEALKPEALHALAWEVVQPHFLRAQQAAQARHVQLARTGQTAHDLGEILPAAHHGRVEALFTAAGVQQWGQFDPETGALTFFATSEPGTEDLLDLAAMQTIINGGVVYPLQRDELPGDSPIAAMFRY